MYTHDNWTINNQLPFSGYLFQLNWLSWFPFSLLSPLDPEEYHWELTARGFIRTGYPSCHPNISVEALREPQSTYLNQSPGIIPSSSTRDSWKKGHCSLYASDASTTNVMTKFCVAKLDSAVVEIMTKLYEVFFILTLRILISGRQCILSSL